MVAWLASACLSITRYSLSAIHHRAAFVSTVVPLVKAARRPCPCARALAVNHGSVYLKRIGANAIALRPQRKKMNIQVRQVFERGGACANSFQTKTPHAAEIMVAPWPME